MRTAKHVIACSFGPDTCPSTISIEIAGSHELRSAGQMLEDVAQLAGWQFYFGRQWCPDHGERPRPRCDCEQRNGIKHASSCAFSKPAAP